MQQPPTLIHLKNPAKVYHFKHLIFEHHDFLGPQFLRRKDHEPKDMSRATLRDWGVFAQWNQLDKNQKEIYRVV